MAHINTDSVTIISDFTSGVIEHSSYLVQYHYPHTMILYALI